MRFLAFLILLLVLPSSSYAKDWLSCQTSCYKKFDGCVDKVLRVGEKLQNICDENARCEKKAEFQTLKNKYMCEYTLKGCMEPCDDKIFYTKR